MYFRASSAAIPASTSSVMTAISASKSIPQLSSSAKIGSLGPISMSDPLEKREVLQESYPAFSLRKPGAQGPCGSGKRSRCLNGKLEAVVRRTKVRQISLQLLSGPNIETRNDLII